ncbi:DUF99 family protein [Salinarchaeum chitinilyticum]
MKSGVRALGVAESYAPDAEASTLAGVVYRGDHVVDGCVFGRCTVGGTDVTESVATLWDRLEREDVPYVLVAGIALAWYNVLDPVELADRIERPVVAVTFEESDGLEDALAAAFEGEALADRLARYEALSERHATSIDGHDLYYRTGGIDAAAAAELLETFVAEGGRPEPLRVARLVARAADDFARPSRDRSPGN